MLFLDAPPAAASQCPARDSVTDQIRCLLELRFASDGQAKKLALAIYDASGSVAGLERAYTMDGGWRGKLKLVPELPVGRHRRHLSWILGAMRDFDTFFAGLAKHATKALPYRYEPLALKFFRSVGRTTPSAYARGWTVAYNVSGSLHRSADAVRETFFHEVFHLNDRAHGDWSSAKLSAIYDDIVAACTTKARKLSTPCLRPYAPNHTMVRGGTFYAFQPGNGVWEYSAELAIRYYRTHRRILAGKPIRGRPFKCGPAQNGKAWSLMVQEFFGGVDLSGACK